MVLRRTRRSTPAPDTAPTPDDPAEVDDAPDTADVDDSTESTGTSKPRDRTRTPARRRPFRSLTPRRWLPFLVLLAVIAAGVVASREDRPDPVTRPVNTPGRMMPVAAPSDALSTAFFCPGGSALGRDGEAELAVVIANAGATPSVAKIELVPATGETVELTLEVPAYDMARVLAADHLDADWVSVTVDVLGGDLAVQQQVTGRGLGSDVAPCPTSTSDEWFVPAGSTAIGAEEHLLVYNPFSAPAVVSFDFTTGGSTTSPRPLQGVTIEGRSLRVFTGDDLPARRDELATRLTTRTGQVVLGRVQTFDGEGAPFDAVREAPEVDAPRGVAATPALPVTSTRWVFPSATNEPTVRNALAIHNPTDRVAEINLVLSYTSRSLNVEIEPIQVTVRPGELQTVDLRDRPGLDDALPYAIFLESFSTGGDRAVPVVAELQVFGAVHRAPPPPISDEHVDPDSDEDDHDHDHDHDEIEEGDPEGEERPEDRSEDDPGDGSDEDEGGEVSGYAAVTGSPVSGGGWIVAEVKPDGDGSSEVTVFNPATTPVSVDVDVVAAGRRDRIDGFELDAGDRRTLDLGEHDGHLTVLVSADGAGIVVDQSVLGEKRGVSRTMASPVPGSVRTLPPPVVG